MTGMLTDVVADMMTRPDADSILLDDGADTWCLEALYDALQREGDDGREYYEMDGCIYEMRVDGYIGSRRYWPADID